MVLEKILSIYERPMNIYILFMDVFLYKVRIHKREPDFFTQNKKKNMHVLSIIRHIFNYHLLGGIKYDTAI